MTSSYLYLLLYLLGSCLGPSVAQRNETCSAKETCGQGQEPTSRFLQCVGLPSSDAGADHARRLKGMLAGAMDVYSFMRSSTRGVPLLSLQGELALNPAADPLQNEALVQMWLQVKIKPLLKSVSRHFLSCLSTKNFSCATYQTVVKELSLHYSEMDPVRQKWIYSFFMYPFLSGDGVAGCVSPQQSGEEWLMKNFGAFRAEARMKDFTTLNLVFSGLEVLSLLSPAQKAELLLRPEVSGLDNGSLSLVFHSLLAGGPPPTAGPGQNWTNPGEGHNLTGPGNHTTNLPKPTYNPQPPPSPLNKLRQILSGVMAASRPIGSFVRDFVSFTRERKASDIKGTTLTQFLFNWTLAELANAYRPPSASAVPEMPQMDFVNVEDWYQHVVVPVLRRFLQSDAALMHENITLAFHELFYLDHDTTAMENDTSEIQDVCSITLDKSQCGLTDAVANVANVLHCAADSNLTMSEETVVRLIEELTQRLNSLMQELLTSDLSAVVSDVKQLFSQAEAPSLNREHLDDPSFIKLWFKVKVVPLGPIVPMEVLSCLSAKNFSCPAFQTLVAAFSENDNYAYTYIYLYFIYPFLLNSNTTDPRCVMSANNSAEWLTKNFGAYLKMASVADFYKLNPNFSGLDVLPLLTPRQLAEMLVLPLPTPPERDVVINGVFDFLLESPEREKLVEVGYYLQYFLPQEKPPCNVYEHIFERLYGAIPLVPRDIEPDIWTFIGELMSVAPDECVPANLMCPDIPYNGTIVCEGVNRTTLQMNGRFCDFTVEELACASLAALTPQDLAAILVCNRSSGGSGPAWKLLLSKASHVLDAALDLLTNATLDPRNPALSMVLDVIREIRLDMSAPGSLNDAAFIQLWFQIRLRAFLPAASADFFSCLTTEGLNCTGYQHLVRVLSDLRPHMTLTEQISVYTHFMKAFLSRNGTSDSSCSAHINSSGEWLQRNLGGFSFLASFHDLRMLYPNFSPLTALPLLTARQLAEVSATPGLLTSAEDVAVVTKHIPDGSLPAFFDDFSSAIAGHESDLPSAVRSAFLQVVFDRANLSDPSTGDADVSLWLHSRLRPLLVGLPPQHVAPFFRILAGRNCSIKQQGVEVLNSTIPSLSEDTQKEIYNNIVQTLKGPTPLNCYGNNYNLSFYSFLERSFMGFQFPNLTTFLSLMPRDRMHQLLNSIPPSGLGDFLRRPDVVDNDAELCVIYGNYIQTPMFLDSESLPESVRRPTLPCVWPVALASSERSEVNAWFDRRLHNYLVFLTKGLISPNSTHNASCLAFQKLVSVLGEYNYTGADFERRQVFDSIRAYLASASAPRCYNPSNPDLNSTAWFAEYIGPFMAFLTLEDLQTFGSAEVMQVFTVNPLNIALLNHSSLPLNLTNYYVELVYQQDSNFNPLLLPLVCRCVAPGPAFSQLSAGDSMMVLRNLTAVCASVDPQVSAALAGNFGNNVDASTISSLGTQCTGLSTGQIKTIDPQQLLIAISTLSGVPGWNQGQARAILQSLMSSGAFQINGTASLLSLGSLIVGVPAGAIRNVKGSALLGASINPSFLQHMASAPQILQQVFVYQIVSEDRNADVIIQNVPDEMATEIPRALLLGLSNSGGVIEKLNQKKWKRQQVELFFDVIAVESATTVLGSPNNLSSSLLQGFTCTGVRSVQVVQIKKLIKACRRRGKNKVALVETQLTCMYNYIKDDSDATLFDLYPPDVLLYYNYSLVPEASCRSYFKQLADADFSVFSSTLGFMATTLFENARSCLGITNTSLTEDNVSVLGNMCCTVNGSYIENSHPSILDKLASCPDLSAGQVAAAEALLQSGKTQYGAPSKWSEQTLKDLGMLPLYLTSTFYDNFDKKTKRRFLRYFLEVLGSNGVGRQKRRSLKKELRQSIKNKSKRSIVNGCTVGTITQVTISDETFPFDYDDVTQFNCCLSASVVRDNLDAIVAKVDQEEYLSVVLGKLREIYPIVPEDQVLLLGPASRLATVADVLTWNITQIDTLSALMNPSDGQWDPILAKAVISRYLSRPGNTLGTDELNAIGGANLCSLDADVLKNISQQSIRDAGALTLSNCTSEKKRVLFAIAEQAFAANTRSVVSPPTFQLTQPFIGGADLAYVQRLATSGTNMDMSALTSLDSNVVLNLTVSEVRGLLGTNLPTLKLYEDQPLVKSWIARQLQSELNTLGIGLVGGRADTTNSPITANSTNSTITTNSTNSTNSTITTNSTNSTITTNSTNTVAPTNKPVTATTTTTGNNGVNVRADAGFSFLLLLSLLVASFV
uniref:Mesothelin a n=1 Tax=Gasterosteus aculeatus aculeatus TaxID=481459 RepID=A0AAQ4R9F9_GASAC